MFNHHKLKGMQPLDRTAIALMLLLGFFIIGLVITGGYTAPKVRNFSWDNRQISAQDRAFIMTFSRPMDKASVEANLKIDPPLPGKISWAGRRMAYTLEKPIAYGNRFELTLRNARDTLTPQGETRRTLRPFVSQFRSRDRIFAYIGVEGEENGRLVLYNLTRLEKEILTPPQLIVTDFKPYKNREQILVAASSREQKDKAVIEQEIYSVTTGLAQNPTSQPPEPGQLERLIDNQDYQNLKFDLTPDGQTIVVQRINRQDPSDSGLWVKRAGEPLKRLESEAGGDFVLTPDSKAIAVTQGQGVALLPLSPDPNQKPEPLDFLPKFGRILSFAGDGSAAALVKFNTNYTRSLFVVTNTGTEQKLLDTTGSIYTCQFSADPKILYCLLSELIPGETYQELPFIAAINLETEQTLPLLALPEQRDTQISLSPDAIALIFDQAILDPEGTNAIGLRTNEGQEIASSLLWLLPLPDLKTLTDQSDLLQTEELPFRGFRPRWLP